MIMKLLLIKTDGRQAFLADTQQKKFHCQYGVIDLSKAGKKITGRKTKSSLGYEFLVLEPAITDMLRKAKRGPQVIMPKDAASIIAETGVSSGWRCLDAGSGSGFLAIFIGSIVKPDGRVYTYEKNRNNFEIVKKNIEFCGLEKVIIAKNKDAKEFTEKNLDLITLDMMHAEKLIKKCHAALKPGGWLCVYSPHIEQQIKARSAMQSGFVQLRTVQNIQRE